MNFIDSTLNQGLGFVLEFGPELNQPIHQRMLLVNPVLEVDELDEMNNLCYKVSNEGYDFMLSVLNKCAMDRNVISSFELTLVMYSYLLSKYLWISEKNIERIYSQACYYAYKDGLIEAILD